MSGWGVNSEYAPLASVLLYRPDASIGNHRDPAAILHNAPIDHAGLMREFDTIIVTFEDLGIGVYQIDDAPLSSHPDFRFNMMYCRDLFLMTPFGAVVANMANKIRSTEPLYATRSLQALGCPILHSVSGTGRFEGADALWLDGATLLIGVGNRTNREGYTQVAAVLRSYGIACIPVPSCQTRTQHLLGSVQIVDRDLALVRNGIIDPELAAILQRHGVSLVSIPECPEVLRRQAMNIVTIAPRTVIMTSACPDTKKIYRAAGLTIAAELELTQLIAGAGGLACATGIVARSVT